MAYAVGFTSYLEIKISSVTEFGPQIVFSMKMWHLLYQFLMTEESVDFRDVTDCTI